MRWVLYLSVLITFGAALSNVVAVGLPYWLYTDRPVESYQGLWQRCDQSTSSRSGNNLECELVKLAPEFLDAVRVMMLFGLSFYIFALIASVLYTCFGKESSGYITAATFFMLFGAIMCMIGVITYGALYPRLLKAKTQSLHAGFGVAVVSTLLGFINTFFYCLAKARGDVESY